MWTMENNNHGFCQPNNGFSWAPSPAPPTIAINDQWNMQQMGLTIAPSDFIPMEAHFESDARFFQPIPSHIPQVPTVNFDLQLNTSFQNINQNPMMMNPNPNPHRFGCVTNPMPINPYPVSQEVNFTTPEFGNTNQFMPFFKQPLVMEQQQPPLAQHPQTTFIPLAQDNRAYGSNFVTTSMPPLSSSIEPPANFQNNISTTMKSEKPYTLTKSCSPETSNNSAAHHEESRESKLMQHTNIRKHEESAKKALLLKRKELKWKLMEASQAQNRAKLEEIRAEADYNKKKMIKIAALASKLRNKFLKVAKASKMAESLYKKVELRLLTQEKFVADEKMQLAKLAVDCRNIGNQLYGPDYILSSNLTSPKSREKQRLASKIKEAKSALNNRMIELERDAFIHSSARKLLASARAQASSLKALEANKPPKTRLSSLYDLKNSLLKNLASYRLTTKFAETGIPITDLLYTHNICANCNICLPDLLGTCTDKNCLYQHKSNYIMTDIDKLADILSYKPSLTGFKADPDQSKEENESQCRLKLKQYAAKLLAKNSDKPVETIAQNLVKYIRANRSDHELLITPRELPKVGHLVCNIPEETVKIDETNSTESDDVSIEEPEEVSIVESDGTSVENNEDEQ